METARLSFLIVPIKWHIIESLASRCDVTLCPPSFCPYFINDSKDKVKCHLSTHTCRVAILEILSVGQSHTTVSPFSWQIHWCFTLYLNSGQSLPFPLCQQWSRFDSHQNKTQIANYVYGISNLICILFIWLEIELLPQVFELYSGGISGF